MYHFPKKINFQKKNLKKCYFNLIINLINNSMQLYIYHQVNLPFFLLIGTLMKISTIHYRKFYKLLLVSNILAIIANLLLVNVL